MTVKSKNKNSTAKSVDETLAMSSDDEDDMLLDNDVGIKKPKSTKKKEKKKDKAGSGNEVEDVVVKPKSTKKKKKKDVVEVIDEEDDNTDDNDGHDGAPKKPKSIKKKPKKTNEDDRGGDDNGEQKQGGVSTSAVQLQPPQRRPSNAPPGSFRRPGSSGPGGREGRGGQPLPGGRGRGRGRGPGGRGPPLQRRPSSSHPPASFRGGSNHLGNISNHGPSVPPPSMQAPRKPESMMRMGGPPPPPVGSIQQHNGSFRAAPSRPASMMHLPSNGGEGRGRGRGREGPGTRRVSAYAAPGRPPSTRNLPPPPGTAVKGKSFAFRSSNHGSGKPPSILRTSSHHMKNTSMRGSMQGPSARINHDGTVTTRSASGDVSNKNFNDSVDSFDIDDDGFFGEDGDEVMPVVSRTPSLTPMVETISKSFRGILENVSTHKGLGAPTPETVQQNASMMDRRTNLSKFQSQQQSMRSVLTLDLDYDDENRFIRFLRYIRLLAPHPDEKPIKKKIRIMTWVALFLDFLAAVVAITTYDDVTKCCGEPMLSVAGDFNWGLAIRIVTYIYIFLIFLEILPVVRDGFPFNLLNPMIGFLITFAVFFDDSITEAVIMWIIEASAVGCEVGVYLLRRRAHNEREERLKKTEKQVLELRGVKKKVKKQYQSARNLDLSAMSNHGGVSSDEDDDESENQDSDSFHDESDMELDATNHTDISQVRELRLLRERRLLRQSQAESQRHLHYHLIGVCINVFLVVLSLVLISSIARSGGLCMVDMTTPNPFKKDQLSMCPDCRGIDGVCEVCNADGTSQCYYPY